MVREGDMMTADHVPERYVRTDLSRFEGVGALLTLLVCRLNIHTDADGTVKKVTHG